MLARRAVAALLLVVALVLVAYGLLALLYGGDGGDTYVTLAGHRVDAHLAGAVAIAAGLPAGAGGVVLARR